MVAASALQDVEFLALCRALGLDALASDPRLATLPGRMMHRELWAEALGAAVAARDLDTLMAGFIAEGAVGGRVNAAADLPGDPQVVHNGAIATIDHGALGRVRVARHPARFGATATEGALPAPLLGEHSRAILAQCGVGSDQIDALISAAVVLEPSATG
jgi:crotonobetainyl-CoA:carnitine CoA-transferase CaiB-like acyl-CoA transferase